jgi:hypothetical protein
MSNSTRVLQCVFVAHPVDRTDRDGDFQVGVALTFSDDTTAENIVRDALRHASGKLYATLEAPPQQMLVLVRFKKQLVRIPIGSTLIDDHAFRAPLDAGEQPMLVLAPPGKVSYVESLTSAQQIEGSPSPHGFASFVGNPSRAGSPRQPDPADAPSPALMRHASEKLQPQSANRGVAGVEMGGTSGDVPLTIKVIYHSMFGERAEAEVPYMSDDPVCSVIAHAATCLSHTLRFPIAPEAAAKMALFYRKKDGTERMFAGRDPLPLPKSATRTPTAYLGLRADAASSSQPADLARPQDAMEGRGSVVGGAEDSRLSAASHPDSGLPDACFDACESLRESYKSIIEETRRTQATAATKTDAEGRRGDLLRRRDGAQQRWTECAAVERDIERLSEQVAWFEQEVATQRDREAELRVKLHKLQSEGRMVSS